MDHLVQFSISIDDKHIANMVEKKAVDAMEAEILKICKNQLGEESSYWSKREPGPLLKSKVDEFFDKHRDEIIDLAADKLAEKLIRTKAVREKVKEMKL